MNVKKNNNDKGFTLIELMAVILLLGIIMSVTTIITVNTIKNSKEKSYNVLVSNIKDAAQDYFEECENDSASGGYLEGACNGLIRENGDNCEADKCATISIDTLLKYDFLKSDSNDSENNKIVENPKTNDSMNICVIELKKYVDEINNYITWYEFDTGSSETFCPTRNEYLNITGETKNESEDLVITSSEVLSNLGLTSSLKNGTPDFSKISPLTTYTQNIASNQTVSLMDTSNSINLGSTISFSSSTGKFTLGSTTTNQTYGENAVGKYTCGNSSSSCTKAYKIISVTNGGISWNEDKDTVEPACDVEYGTAIEFGSTVIKSGTGYKLSGTISAYDAADLYNNPEMATGWSCCGGTTCTENDLFKAEYYETTGSESGTIWGIYPRDLTVGDTKVTKADVYTSTSSKNTADVGIFATTDDLGPSYYFRGDVTNNYVKFAGFYWRIIRINGDGSVRMIYDGTSAYSNGTSSTNRRATTSAYANSIDATSYLVYNSGNIPGVLTSWYNSNLNSYASYIQTSQFCSDEGGFYFRDSDEEFGDAYIRLVNSKNPTLVCSQTAYINSSKIGLITADEISMAGGVYNTTNNLFYLYIGNGFYTMTPYGFESTGAGENLYSKIFSYYNNFTRYETNTSSGIRPVISLKPNAITGGNGTATNPFVVG